MSWRKGFFRLWVVFAVLWLVGVGAFSYGDWETYQDASQEVALLDKFEKADKTEKAEMLSKDPLFSAEYTPSTLCGLVFVMDFIGFRTPKYIGVSPYWVSYA